MILVYCSVGWIAGIYLASRAGLGLPGWGLALLLPASALWLWRHNPRARLLSLSGLLLVLGAARYVMALPRSDPHSVSAYNDKGLVTLVGVIAAEPEIRDASIQVRLRAETLVMEENGAPGGLQRVRGTVLVRLPRYPEPLYGDRLEVRGRLETPPILEGFDYRAYLSRQGIHSLVNWGRVTIVKHGQGNRLLAALLALKQRTQQVIAAILTEPCAALLTGILLGNDSAMPQELVDSLRASGTSHIVAISGFNIAIVAGLCSSWSVRLVGRRYAAWFATATIALYTVFVGASASVLRAALMGIIAVWGQHLGRQYSAPNGLAAAALLMTAWNPLLLWDLGFLLSFSATLGLILFASPFQRGFGGLMAHLLPAGWAEPVVRLLNGSLILTVCAQVVALPVMLSSFRQVSLVTLISNALVLPAQPQVMMWGAAAAAAGLVWLPVGRVLGWVAWLFLSYTIWVVEAAARIPHAVVELGKVNPALIAGWCGFCALAAWWLHQPDERRKVLLQELRQALPGRLSTRALMAGLGIALVLVVLALVRLPDGKLHVTVLDVENGNAVLVVTPAGEQVLVGSGSSPSQLLSHLAGRMPFWDRSLGLVVLTDGRNEQLLGMISVLERYRVGHVLEAVSQDVGSAAGRRWQEVLRAREIAAERAVAGTRVELGDGVSFAVLYPSEKELADGRSQDSDQGAMIRVDYGRTCFLLTGDAGPSAWTAVLARGERVQCQVLQLGRRGSLDAASADFLETVRPAVAIVSYGGDGSGEQDVPDALAQTVERLTQQGTTVLRTDQRGSVQVVSDGVRYEVRVER